MVGMDSQEYSYYRRGLSVTLTGMVVNILLIVLKIWGGYVAHSHALLADGVHSISDLATDVVVLAGLKIGRSVEDERHPFGHGRIETLASMIVGVALVGAGLYIAWSATQIIIAGTSGHPTYIAIVIAVLSVVSKECLYQYTKYVGKKLNSPALLSNAWHHRSDALSSIAVIVGVAAAQIRPDWGILDCWAAIVVAVMIVHVGGTFIISSVSEFIDTAPEPDVVKRIVECATEVDGVRNVHDLRARTSGGKVFVELHVEVDGEISVRHGHSIAKAVEKCLITEINHLSKATIHVDPIETEDAR